MKKLMLAVAIAGITFAACQRKGKQETTSDSEKVSQTQTEYVQTESILFSQNNKNAQIEEALVVHNSFMKKLLENQIQAKDELGLIDAIVTHMKENFQEVDAKLLKEQLLIYQKSYAGLSNSDLIKALYNNKVISGNLMNGLLEVVTSLDQVAEQAPFTAYMKRLSGLLNVVPKKYNFTDDDLVKFQAFMRVAENGADLYNPKYNRICCNNCLKAYKSDIIIGDAAGAVVGIVACFVFPPACPYLLPALIAFGSGGAIFMRCPCCRP